MIRFVGMIHPDSSLIILTGQDDVGYWVIGYWYWVLGIAPSILTARMVWAWAQLHHPGLATGMG